MIVHYHSLPNKGDILPHLWYRLQEDDPPPWFWGNYPALTMTEFVIYFSDPLRHLFCACTQDGNEITGMLWIDEIILGQRARAHFYFFRKYRGTKTGQIKLACLEILHALRQPPFSLQTLLLFTDIRATDAIRVAKKFGAKYLGELPYYYPGEYPVLAGYLLLKGEPHNGLNLRQHA